MSAFSFFDKDGSGYITIDELQQACKEFGLSEVHLDDMIKEIDQDNVRSFIYILTMMTPTISANIFTTVSVFRRTTF
jgi:Ca2+-binding EF-hand superfamily protein